MHPTRSKKLGERTHRLRRWSGLVRGSGSPVSGPVKRLSQLPVGSLTGLTSVESVKSRMLAGESDVVAHA